MTLLPQHAKLIEESGISLAVRAARGYRSATTKADLQRLGFGASQSRVPALVIPVRGVSGEIVTYQIRPDEPRIGKQGKALKYETPHSSRMVLDVPFGAKSSLANPKIPLFITEGARKADAAVSYGLCCISLLGVWSWRGTNEYGGKTALPDWDSIALNERETFIVFDSDVMHKPPVHAAMSRLTSFLRQRGARVAVIYLPPSAGGQKVGLDDFFAANHTVEELLRFATSEVRQPLTSEAAQDDLPTIEVGGRRLSEKTADALEALLSANDRAPRLFQHGGALVRLRSDDNGGIRMEPLTQDALRGELDRVARWTRTTQHGSSIIDPPLPVVKNVLSLPEYDLPLLRGIATAPFFTRAGQLVVDPGYHVAAGLYLDERSEFNISAVPAAPHPGGYQSCPGPR
jgi:hypothetical protein